MSLENCMSCEKFLMETLSSIHVLINTLVKNHCEFLSLKDKWSVLSLLEDKQNYKFGGVC